MNKMAYVLFFIVASVGTSHASLSWVPFTVTHHVDNSYAVTTFDNALNVGNERLKYDNHNCTDDVPCTARFYRSGALGTFGTVGDGLDIITTSAESNSVFAVTSHRAKMVTVIDYCSGYNPSIVGCGRVNGFGFIVELGEPGNTYIHEYGHNVGLGHRDDCNMNIMNTYTNGTNDSLNSSECTTFGGKAYTTLCGTVYNGSGGPLTVSGGPYWVTCNVTVPSYQSLTIDAGVEIQFDQGGRKIISYGTTTADGTSSRISIYSNNETNNYPGMTVDGPLTISSGGELVFD